MLIKTFASKVSSSVNFVRECLTLLLSTPLLNQGLLTKQRTFRQINLKLVSKKAKKKSLTVTYRFQDVLDDDRLPWLAFYSYDQWLDKISLIYGNFYTSKIFRWSMYILPNLSVNHTIFKNVFSNRLSSYRTSSVLLFEMKLDTVASKKIF